MKTWGRATRAQRVTGILAILPTGSITADTIRQVLDACDKSALTETGTLYTAAVTAMKQCKNNPTTAHIRTADRSATALEQHITALATRQGLTERTLPNALAVTAYLKGLGRKTGKSTIYNHTKEGKLRRRPDGTYSLADVDRYAQEHLPRLDGEIEEPTGSLQQQKLQAEIDKTRAQAQHWDMRTKVFTGAYVPKDLYEAELAKRAAILRNDLETFARAEAAEIVAQAKGDAETIPDMTEWLLNRFEQFLDRYAEERTFKVPLPPQDKSDSSEQEADQEVDE